MPSVCKKWAQNKQSYLRKKEHRRESSWEDPDKHRAAPQASKDPDKKRAASRTSYWRYPDKKRAASRASYWKDPESKRASSRASSYTHYWEDPESKRASSHTRYWEDPESKRASSYTRYWEDPESKRASSHTLYWEDPEKGRAASCVSSRTSYWRNPGKIRAAAHMTNLKVAKPKLKWYRRYYAKYGKGICASKRRRYALAEPKGSVIEVHVKKIQHQLLANAGAKLKLLEAFKKHSKYLANDIKNVTKTLPSKVINTPDPFLHGH